MVGKSQRDRKMSGRESRARSSKRLGRRARCSSEHTRSRAHATGQVDSSEGQALRDRGASHVRSLHALGHKPSSERKEAYYILPLVT